MNIYYTVYQITNLMNNKIYVGVHATKDPNDSYYGSSRPLRYSMKKYGRQNFIKEILFNAFSLEDAYYVESIIVDKDFIQRKDTYNIKLGGIGGGTCGFHTEQTKQKISKSLKNRPFSRRPGKVWMITDLENQVCYRANNLTIFCEQHQIKYHSLKSSLKTQTKPYLNRWDVKPFSN